MRIEVIKDLVKVADSLDKKGLYKESDMVDSLILKLADVGPQCPQHPLVDLEPKKKGWYCEECERNVLSYDQHPRSGSPTDANVPGREGRPSRADRPKPSGGRPTKDEIEDIAQDIYSLPAMRRFSVITDIEEMAGGADLEGIRAKHYPGWENEDFKALFDRLES